MALKYKWAALEDVLNAALASAPTGKICVLPDTTYVNITRVVNLVVSETKVDTHSENDCPEPPNKAMSPEKVKLLTELSRAHEDVAAKQKVYDDAVQAHNNNPSNENAELKKTADGELTTAKKTAADAQKKVDEAK